MTLCAQIRDARTTAARTAFAWYLLAAAPSSRGECVHEYRPWVPSGTGTVTGRSQGPGLHNMHFGSRDSTTLFLDDWKCSVVNELASGIRAARFGVT